MLLLLLPLVSDGARKLLMKGCKVVDDGDCNCPIFSKYTLLYDGEAIQRWIDL